MSRQPLVLLHGWGMNKVLWSPLTAKLEQRFTLHLLELPGHGEAPFPDIPDNHSMAGWANYCLDQAPEKAVWLGWSLGGMVAMQAALQAPQRVESLISVASSPRFVQDSDWPNAMDPKLLEQFAAELISNHRVTLKRFLALQVRGGKDAQTLLRTLKQALSQAPETDQQALRVGLELLRHSDLRKAAGQLSMPSCWIFGGRDTLCPASQAKQISMLVPAAQTSIIDAAAHAPFLSHGEEFSHIINNFLDSQ